MEIQEKKKLTRVGDLDMEIHETMNAPTLPPAVLDGLIWRSRNQEAGMHRANYYLKHLHIDEDGTFPKTLMWCVGATLSGALGSSPIHLHQDVVLLHVHLWEHRAKKIMVRRMSLRPIPRGFSST